MMNCNECKNQMPYYIDQELQGQPKAEFERHLQDCTVCAKQYQAFKGIYGYIEQERITDSDPFFYTRLMARWENRSGSYDIRALRLKPLSLAFAIVIPLIAGLWLGFSLSRHQNEQAEVKLVSEMHNTLTAPGYEASLENYVFSDSE